MLKYFINKSKFKSLLRIHKFVPFQAIPDKFHGFAGVFVVDEIELVLEVGDFLGLDENVGGLALSAPTRLMHHYSSVWQRMSHAVSAGGQKETAHAASLADAPRGDGGQDVLHGVVDGEASCHAPPGGVDVHVDGLLRALRLQEKQLRYHYARNVVIDGPHEANDPVLEKAAVDVVGPLPPPGLLDDDGYEVGGGGPVVEIAACLSIIELCWGSVVEGAGLGG